jgi:hypothetical protein
MVVFLRSVRRLLVTVSVVPSALILVALMKEALSFSETSVLARATWHNIPEDTILNSILCLLSENYLLQYSAWMPHSMLVLSVFTMCDDMNSSPFRWNLNRGGSLGGKVKVTGSCRLSSVKWMSIKCHSLRKKNTPRMTMMKINCSLSHRHGTNLIQLGKWLLTL